jgi:hypothetical protein
MRVSGGSRKVFSGAGGELGEQPSMPEPSTGQQNIVMKVHPIVSWLQFTDMLNKYNLLIV